MDATHEVEALEVTRARVEAAERRRPWLLSEAKIADERKRSRIDLFFHSLAGYIERNRIEPSDLM